MMPPKRSRSDHLTPTPSPNIATKELITKKHVTKTMANYGANRNNAYEQKGVGSSIHASNSNVPMACTYEEFMN